VASEAYRQRRQPYRLDIKDLGAGLEQLLDTGAVDFMLRQNFWQMMTPAEQEVLSELAQDRGRPPAGRRHGRHNQAYATLAAQGLVSAEGIKVGLFAEWLRDRLGEE
jgi:hypothetical protein